MMTWYLMKICHKEERERNKEFMKTLGKTMTMTRETLTEAIIEVGIMKKREIIRVETEARMETVGERRGKGETIGVEREMMVEIRGMIGKRETIRREVERERDINITRDIVIREIMRRGLTRSGEVEITEDEVCAIIG